MSQSFGALNKVFNLINKTGDRCIILSPDNDEAFAIMSLDAYERLALGRSDVASLTEDQLLDKINRDIAVWKSQQEEQEQDNQENDWAEQKAWQRKWDEPEDEKENWGQWDSDEDEEDMDFEDEDEEIEEDPYYFESVDR